MDLTNVSDELNLMLDDGVTVSLDDLGDGAFVLNLHIDTSACADCVVPDETLAGIAEDTLRRVGATVSTVSVHRPV